MLLFLVNATPVAREGYRTGVPGPGFYQEILNTDAETYGGGNVGNCGGQCQRTSRSVAGPVAFAGPAPAAVERRRLQTDAGAGSGRQKEANVTELLPPLTNSDAGGAIPLTLAQATPIFRPTCQSRSTAPLPSPP